MTLFERVKETAKSKGFALAELARRAGIGEKSIYTWKPTKQFPDGIEPKRETLEKVADVLGVSVDYLLGNTDEMHSNKKDDDPVDLYTVTDDERDRLISANGQPISDEDWIVIKALLAKYPKRD
ncbi:helix-turn-helix domain-containing protein [Weissella confusa]|uniref:helix-turn-helix domain-containing protein n=1 Tax=Weissella TaxID=46255 RepID=UPI00107F4739|nr:MULTISPECIES: helix-turn-helix domain-containing protein [Weissella]MBJ7621111.1 helix-turn-helix domain-containing protein [Weissella confusa]MBJ7635687.1 helix-turn-helix domain-containing protein [Weissella confusa]MBJ7668424.1 helix-turn-helix domain-containing protein [Weissella confusa]MCA1354691.1 helix-turn-helix domain-containing protein [Weissella cibaria]MCT8398512.1 XRE family transcriptional regulator [Weissella cibaria]